MDVQFDQIVGDAFQKFRELEFGEPLAQPVTQKLNAKFRLDGIQGAGP